MDEKEIGKILEKYYNEDFHYSSGHILGSMYTSPPEIAIKAFIRFYQANLGNPGLYPGTVKMEQKVVKFLLKLTSGKPDFYGHIVSGGTEANIIALWAARNMGYKRILTTKDVHFSIIKAAKLLRISMKYIEMKNYTMDPEDLRRNLEDGDIVVATAGTTPLGYVDPIREIGEICDMHSCYLHIDAAFGGFVIPFLDSPENKKIDFGFEIPMVDSITIDPHKMGFAPYPAGGLLARYNIFKQIETNAPYLSSGKNSSILGTRQSGSVAAAYAAILHFGWHGYHREVEKCMENTYYLLTRAKEEDFIILTKPVLNIVNIKVEDETKIKKQLFKIGWAVSTNPKYSSLRMVIMPHVKKEVIDNFLQDLKKL